MSGRFIIVYRGREGSSPIIDLLKRHPDVATPVFEDLDLPQAKSFSTSETIARLVELTLQFGDFKLAREMFENGGDWPEATTKAVGFKWRIWGDPDSVVEMCVRQGVRAFHLFRANLLDLALSLHFSHTVVPEVERTQGMDLQGGGHLQFKLLKMTEEQRQELRSKLNSIQFSVDLEQFIPFVRQMYEGKQGVHDRYIVPMTRAGVPVHTLLYEDFVQDRSSFFRSVCPVIGIDPRKIENRKANYQRVGSGKLHEQVTNWAEIEGSPELRTIIDAYDQLIAKIPNVHRSENEARVGSG